jgi:DNA-binding MarR family transcriptional regulator
VTIFDTMILLKVLDRRGLTPRDVLVLWTVRESPGCMGHDVKVKLGYPGRSSVQGSIERLIREGYIEDRRVKTGKFTPNQLHLLPVGEKLWQELVG